MRKAILIFVVVLFVVVLLSGCQMPAHCSSVFPCTGKITKIEGNMLSITKQDESLTVISYAIYQGYRELRIGDTVGWYYDSSGAATFVYLVKD